MAFVIPEYHHPDFSLPKFMQTPDAAYQAADQDGVAPGYFHSTSMYPEYFEINGTRVSAEESRTDSSVVIYDDGHPEMVENRDLKGGDKVILGHSENCEGGVYMHYSGFAVGGEKTNNQFVFRQGRNRETSCARDYDDLSELPKYEGEHGNILWAIGPTFSFDHDAQVVMRALVRHGYAHGLMAGNTLIIHDPEGALPHTTLGQDIYTQASQPNGHHSHSDVVNEVRRSGSIPKFIEDYHTDNGVIFSCIKGNISIVFTRPIRGGGPLPEVIGDTHEGQGTMRGLVRRSTYVVCLVIMLHIIVTNSMAPSFRVMPDRTICPVYLYTVDMDELAVNELLDRGSLSATTIVTNVQDFILTVAEGLGVM